MIPIHLQPYVKMVNQKRNGDNYLVSGTFTCCDACDFEVFVVGRIKYGIFSKMCLYPENDITVVKIRCKKCGRVISVFDSSCDGYERCGKGQYTQIPAKPIVCKACNNGGFSVCIKYEYPDIQDLKELDITEIDNAFTWIWITLECNKCGTRYKNFVESETD